MEREIAPLLPAAAEVKTGDEQAESDKAVVSEAITFIRGFLLAFGGIALFVGAFVIFNTLSITVAQRSRELATLRTLGASRRQVLRSVIAEAGIIGLAASVVGPGPRLRPGQGPVRHLPRRRGRHAPGGHGLRDAHGRGLAGRGHRSSPCWPA